MNVRVDCFSGRDAHEQPVRFYLGERVHIVEEIMDQWYGANATYFTLRSDDGNIYILSHYVPADKWELEAFRRE